MVTKTEIKKYLELLYSQEVRYLDEAVYDDIRLRVPGNSDYEVDILEFMDREVLNIKKYDVVKIDDNDIDKIAYWLDVNIHEMPLYAEEVIKSRYTNSYVCGDNLNQKLSFIDLLIRIKQGIFLQKMFGYDARMMRTKPRDRNKIIEAIDMIYKYTDDVHLIYHLNKERDSYSTNSITRTDLMGSIFFNLYSRIIVDLSNTKSMATDMTNKIMDNIFSSGKAYRPYKNTKTIKYKKLLLKTFIK